MTKKQKKLLQRITAAAVCRSSCLYYIRFVRHKLHYYRLGYYLESLLQYPSGRSV